MLLAYEFLVRIECEVEPTMTFGEIADDAAKFELQLRNIAMKPSLRSVTLTKDQ